MRLNASPGEGAKAALMTKRPDLGFCLAIQHAKKLHAHIARGALSENGTEGSPRYNVKYAEHVGKKRRRLPQTQRPIQLRR